MRRTTFWILVSFAMGICTAFGLSYLGEKTSIPSLDSTMVFEVRLPDGSTKHLSYSEIERDREELKVLRERLRILENRRDVSRLSPKTESSPQPQASEDDKKNTPPSKDQAKGSSKNLSTMFSKLISPTTMTQLATEQVKREAGELAAVLDLNKDERARLEKILSKKKKVLAPSGSETDKSAEEKEMPESQKSLDEELHTLLTPEQFSRYQEYAEKKKALSGASALDKELFELRYRLDLTEEQETPAKEILKEQGEKIQHLSLSPAPDEGISPLERIQSYLDQKSSFDKETARRMQQILNQKQYASFLQYQDEKSAEVQLLKNLLEEEAKAQTTP